MCSNSSSCLFYLCLQQSIKYNQANQFEESIFDIITKMRSRSIFSDSTEQKMRILSFSFKQQSDPGDKYIPDFIQVKHLSKYPIYQHYQSKTKIFQKKAIKLQKIKFDLMLKIIKQMQKKAKLFLLKNKEDGDFNQYWYSDKSIMFLANQAIKSQRCCFLSTPSIYYSIENPNHEKPLVLFDYDKKFANKNPNFFQYDFNHPELIPQKYHNYFDFVLADPPFITFQVWQKYAEAIRKIIKKDQNGNIQGRILLSTIQENQQFLIGLLGVKSKTYKPSIPNLVYQYCLYSNYDDQELDKVNPEIGE